MFIFILIVFAFLCIILAVTSYLHKENLEELNRKISKLRWDIKDLEHRRDSHSRFMETDREIINALLKNLKLEQIIKPAKSETRIVRKIK